MRRKCASWGGGVGLPGPWDLDWDGCEWLVEQGRGDYGWLWTLSGSRGLDTSEALNLPATSVLDPRGMGTPEATHGLGGRCWLSASFGAVLPWPCAPHPRPRSSGPPQRRACGKVRGHGRKREVWNPGALKAQKGAVPGQGEGSPRGSL